MTIETWLAFTSACIVLTLIPGPSVLLVIGQSITRGKRAAMMCILGDVLGGIVLMGLSFAGVGAILAASAALFQIVKWAGVVYLAYLGYRQIAEARRDTETQETAPLVTSSWGSFWAGTVTAILNPKAIVFYMAFLAQFIDPAKELLPQLTILTVTSTLVVMVLLGAYAMIAARARQTFRSHRARRRMGYTGGTFMIGGSVLIATTR
ncbi:LysE family translocator [Rhodospirillaceae bacterium KN72]|uniref:LysE family translocator n=1 Tax=Pacificispira spongiicola TaxID=2729598 RepID=A0A7Y0E3B9_9PROT|nr:LysE family translocator [Pacificispira spongiicola]NMM46436.1 LysE family translocator [Pacificispira spongiicola]